MNTQPTTKVIAQYLTIGGATVDIDELYMSRCSGCGEDDGDDRFVSRVGASLSWARSWAQTHAEKCRAVPVVTDDSAVQAAATKAREVLGRYDRRNVCGDWRMDAHYYSSEFVLVLRPLLAALDAFNKS